MHIEMILDRISCRLFGWPLIIYVVALCLITTFYLGFVQFRYFFSSFRYTFFPQESTKKADMSPFQAFVNTLNSSIGNGSIAGMAVALHCGGPGAAIWVLIIGVLLMAIRYCEIYLSTFYGSEKAGNTIFGGPMVYLKDVFGGVYLPTIYAVLALFFGLTAGNAAQTNSIRLSLASTWDVPILAIAIVLTLLVFYILVGGAKRIVVASEAIVPVKILVFFISAFIVLAYHYQNIIPALQLMFQSAFTPWAVIGGSLGVSVQMAIRFGINQTVFATETGLGTSAIMFGATGSETPVKDGIMSMLTTLISTTICFLVTLCIVASNVLETGLTSTALTTAAYKTVFGTFGGAIVTFLAASFGIGVLIAYAYVTRAAWLYLTKGRGLFVFNILYCFFAFGGVLVKVSLLWKLIEYVNVSMLVINLFGIACLLPLIRKGLVEFAKKEKAL